MKIQVVLIVKINSLWLVRCLNHEKKRKIQIMLVLMITELRRCPETEENKLLRASECFKIELDRATLGHHDISFILDFLLTLNTIWILPETTRGIILSPAWNFIYRIKLQFHCPFQSSRVPVQPLNGWILHTALDEPPWAAQSGRAWWGLYLPFRYRSNHFQVSDIFLKFLNLAKGFRS